MGSPPSALAGLDDLERRLEGMLELVADRDTDTSVLRERWAACEAAFAEVEPLLACAREHAAADELRGRLERLTRLHALVLDTATREQAAVAQGLHGLRVVQSEFAFYRPDAAGESCDITG